MRGGRFSVLLPSGSRGRLSGLVRGRSASGHSFYFEPSEVVEGNDELERIAADKEIERARIFAELVRQVLELTPAIIARIDFLAAVDALQAVARFAAQVGAGLAGIAPTEQDGSAAALELPRRPPCRFSIPGSPSFESRLWEPPAAGARWCRLTWRWPTPGPWC